MRNLIDNLCIIGTVLLPAFLWVIWNTPTPV